MNIRWTFPILLALLGVPVTGSLGCQPTATTGGLESARARLRALADERLREHGLARSRTIAKARLYSTTGSIPDLSKVSSSRWLAGWSRLEEREDHVNDVVMGGVMGLVMGHTMANDGEPIRLFGGAILPFVDSVTGAGGLVWVTQFD